MRKAILRLCYAVATAALLAPTGHAQVSPDRAPTQVQPVVPSIKLTMEDRHVLKENLLKKAQATEGSAQVEAEAGKQVPASVQLRAFPDDIAGKIPSIKSHQYVIAGGSIVIVEPQERKIVEVIK